MEAMAAAAGLYDSWVKKMSCGRQNWKSEQGKRKNERLKYLAAAKAWKERASKELAEGKAVRTRRFDSASPLVRQSPSSSPPPELTVMAKFNEIRKSLRSGPGNDTGGIWPIDCPEIRSWYDHSSYEYRHHVVRPPSSTRLRAPLR
jgi:hypothetical protein